MFPKTLQGFYKNRKNIPIRAIFTKKYRMFPENRFKKVPVKRFCAKKSKRIRRPPAKSQRSRRTSKPFGVSVPCLLQNLIFFSFSKSNVYSFKPAGIRRARTPHQRYPAPMVSSDFLQTAYSPKNAAIYTFLIYILLTNL